MLQTAVTANGHAARDERVDLPDDQLGLGRPLPAADRAGRRSTGVTVQGQALVRLGDQIPSGPGVLTILGPPAAPFVSDGNSP